jgi:uncharacterized protein involved in outer membrane biogenesis
LLGVIVIIAATIGAIGIALDTGHWREPLARFLAARAGRPLTIEGPVEILILSLHPHLIAEQVTLGNPPWMPAGTAAEFGKITLVFAMPWFGRPAGIERLDVQGATLHLARDAEGHANWQWSPPGKRTARSMPIIRSLSIPDARVELDDARRHLQFRGVVSAREVGAAAGNRPLRIEGEGQLNGRGVTFQIDSDPLVAASHAAPYGFTFTERSSGSQVTGRGSLLRPFDFTVLDTDFEAAGPDLKDLYYLTGVTLVNTGAYRLTGKLARRGHRTLFNDLAVNSGQSDVRGSVTIETTDGRPNIDVDLNSQLLRFADLGTPAAGRPSGTGPPLLLSKVSFKPDAARRHDGVINFHARRVEVGRESLQAVAAKLTMDHGVLLVAPLTGELLDGTFSARARIDATTDDPTADLDLTIKDLQLGRLGRKDAAQPPMEGLLRVRVLAKGHGTSLHQAAASADGTVTAVLPSGALRASLAELTGIDLRGVGLLFAKNTQQTAVHCGVASFRAHDGALDAQSLVIDTDSVLITGEGTIHLDTEELDLALHGHPKGLRLVRLRSPVLVRGTLSHPSAGIRVRDSAAQAAEAIALGVALTPLASVLAFVDPGLAKDADCAALLAAAHTLDAQSAASFPPARAAR